MPINIFHLIPQVPINLGFCFYYGKLKCAFMQSFRDGASASIYLCSPIKLVISNHNLGEFKIMQLIRSSCFFSLMAIAAIVLLPHVALAQNKFFSTSNRGGADSGRGTAQIQALLGENQRANTCTAAGLIFAPTHPLADAGGCTPAAGQRDLADGLTVGANAQVSGSLSIGGDLSVSGQVHLPGSVGIGSTPPATTLDVAGAIKVAGDAETCAALTEGSIRYNSASQQMEFCNGTAWGAMGGGGSFVSKYGSGIRCPGDDFVAVCGYEPGSAWNYNVCYSRGHAVTHSWSLNWNSSADGYQYNSGGAVDVICAGGAASGSSGGGGGASVPMPPTCSGAGYGLQWDGSGWLCDGETLIGGKASSQCTSSGGSLFDTGAGKICRFNQSSCPSGWSTYQDYSATSPNDTTGGYCMHNPSTSAPTGCITGGHSFANTAVESCAQFSPCSGCGCSGSVSYANVTARGCI